MSKTENVRDRIAQNPRLTGAVLTLLLLLAQAGNAAAGVGFYPGP